MNKITLLFIVLLSVFTDTYACLNYYYSIDKEGHLHETSGFAKFNINFNKQRNISKLRQLESKLKKEHSYFLLSDYAVGLMKLGKANIALDILRELYAYYPNDFRIASNLGTAYELNGKPDSALIYIKRTVELNKNDHAGSEWVHIRVLETKLALQKDATYLKTHTVLQLTPNQLKDSATVKQILIQAQERFPFTPGTDPIMASILTDLADGFVNVYSVEYAKAIYEVALNYYGADSALVNPKIRAAKKLLSKYIALKPDIRPKDGFVLEGGHSRIGNVPYKTIMDNNDGVNYQVNWSKINLDVQSLLALVDFTQSTKQLHETSVSSNEPNPVDSLEYVGDTLSIQQELADTTKAKDASEIESINTQERGFPFLIATIIGVILIVIITFFLLRK